MLNTAAMIALTLQAAASSPPRSPPAKAAPFADLWADWSRLNDQAGAAEEELARSGAETRSAGEAAALGERVGEIVARGDCLGGERMALQAGDILLARAVRDHCRRPSIKR
jgi:hypothetical protein